MKFQVNMVQKLLIFQRVGLGEEDLKLSGLCVVFTLCTHTRTLQMDVQHNRVKK